MDRRSFIKSATLGTIAIGLGSSFQRRKTHVLTLSFDDGFKKSFYKTAEIYEQFGLRACLNVIASGHLPDFRPPDKFISPDLLGNFDDWNALKKRGHEIMMHTWDHTNLTQQPLDNATALIDKCISYFEKHLEGFEASKAVYNFAFNASTPELEKYALTKVPAVRTGGDSPINSIPDAKNPVRLGCWSHGPGNIDKFLDEQINKFLGSSGGWFVFNTHGVDDEGWGPISAKYLTSLLKRLVKIENLEILPVGDVLILP